jgi:hypothetical protein
MPAPAATATVTPAESDENIRFAEIDDDEEPEEFEELDEVA